MTEHDIKQYKTYVAPQREAQSAELGPVDAPYSVGDIVHSNAHTGHARQDDNALTHAKASLLVSAAYGVAAGMITLGLLLIVWIFHALGDRLAVYFYAGLLSWGVFTLVILLLNRRQGLHHSSSGIAHHEIDAKTDIAFHAIDTHAELLREKWRLERENRKP